LPIGHVIRHIFWPTAKIGKINHKSTDTDC